MVEINTLLTYKSESFILGGKGYWRPIKPEVQKFVVRFKGAIFVLLGKAEAIYWKDITKD
jgi:hypothetical protein